MRFIVAQWYATSCRLRSVTVARQSRSQSAQVRFAINMLCGCMVRQRKREKRGPERSAAIPSACKDLGRAAIAITMQNTVAPLCGDMPILKARKRGMTAAKRSSGLVPGQSSGRFAYFCLGIEDNRQAGGDLTIDVPRLRRACFIPNITTPSGRAAGFFIFHHELERE